MSVLLDEGELDASSCESYNQLACALAFSFRSTTRERKEFGFDWLQIALKKQQQQQQQRLQDISSSNEFATAAGFFLGVGSYCNNRLLK